MFRTSGLRPNYTLPEFWPHKYVEGLVRIRGDNFWAGKAQSLFDILENKGLAHPSPLKGGSFSVQPFLSPRVAPKQYTTPALGIYNTLHIMTLMCVTVKNANLSGQCSDRTRPNYTDFFHHSRDCQNSVKTDAMSNIMMQYIITKFNWKIVCLCDATYSEKWCREHQRTFLSKYVYKIAKCIICLMTMVNRSCYNFKINWAIEKPISDSDSARVFTLGTLKT